MIRSVRFTLTLWYSGILAVILCIFSWVLYTNVSHNLEHDIEDVLVSQADGVADAIFAYWKGEWDNENFERPNGGLVQPFSFWKIEELAEEKLSSMVARWADETGESETIRPVRILDLSGKIIVSSASFERLALPVTPFAVAETRHQHTVYETFQLLNNRYRLLTRPVIEEGKMLYLVQVVSTLVQADASLRRLRLWLFWLVPSTLVVTTTVGWFLVGAAFVPVGRMIKQAQRISAQHLHKRIDVPKTGDEIERLALTFNDMLGRLERTFRRLRQFSSAASHELRTPLTVMRGELELALRRTRDTEEYQRVIKTHLQIVQEMGSIVEQLLMLARSEEGEESIQLRPVDLNELVRRVQRTFQPIADANGVRLEATDYDLLWVRGERLLLQRMIANLLENALKHTSPGGQITVKTSYQNHHACVRVQDTGSGISPEELPKIFNKFFSGSSSIGDTNSIGLGLGLCRWIAEAHRGRIEVSSILGQGSTFLVFLPLEAAEIL